METMTVLSRAVQTLLLGLFLLVPVLDSVQVGTADHYSGPTDAVLLVLTELPLSQKSVTV